MNFCSCGFVHSVLCLWNSVMFLVVLVYSRSMKFYVCESAALNMPANLENSAVATGKRICFIASTAFVWPVDLHDYFSGLLYNLWWLAGVGGRGRCAWTCLWTQIERRKLDAGKELQKSGCVLKSKATSKGHHFPKSQRLKESNGPANLNVN